MGEKDVSVVGGQHTMDSHSLLQADEPIDRYLRYLSQGVPSVREGSNSRNLFADSDSEDRKWLKLARKHLQRSS